jgi:heme-degrading monooxygenase HmoA
MNSFTVRSAKESPKPAGSGVSTLMSTQEIIVVVQLRLNADYREEFLRTLFDIVEHSRIAPECLSYELFSRAEDHNMLVLFQIWRTREAFKQNWVYSDLPRINTNSHLLLAPIESWELLELPF